MKLRRLRSGCLILLHDLHDGDFMYLHGRYIGELRFEYRPHVAITKALARLKNSIRRDLNVDHLREFHHRDWEANLMGGEL